MLQKLFHQPYPHVVVASCLPCSFQTFMAKCVSGMKKTVTTAEIDPWLAGHLFPTLQGPFYP